PKHSARALFPEGVGFFRQVRDVDVEEPVAVHVAEGDAHSGLGLAHRVVSHTALHGLLAERTVMLVDPQAVRRAVVGDENVGPAVAVEVGAHHAQARTGERADARGFGYVFESHTCGFASTGPRSGAHIVEQSADAPAERSRGTVVPLTRSSF